MPATWIEDLLQPEHGLRPVDDVLSAMGPVDVGTHYDSRAALYDRLVGSDLYNRLVWATSPGSYAAFAAAAVADSDGPLLDAGCGSAIFTAEAYRSTGRRVVLVDNSLGMLARAAQRLQGHDPDRIAFVQADLFELPFRITRAELDTAVHMSREGSMAFLTATPRHRSGPDAAGLASPTA